MKVNAYAAKAAIMIGMIVAGRRDREAVDERVAHAAPSQASL